MHSHARYKSESSNTTSSSGCTDQTYVPEDNASSDCDNNSKTYKEQAVGFLHERCNSAAVGFNEEYEPNKQSTKLSMQNRSPVPKQTERIPLRWQKSEVLSRDPFYIPESSPLLNDSTIDYRRFIESDHAEILKLKKKYGSLRKMFFILAFLCIILIVCVISVLPVTLVSFRIGNNYGQPIRDNPTPGINDAFEKFVFEQLRSEDAKDIIWKHIFCSECHEKEGDAYISESLESLYYLGCCQEDFFSDFKTFKNELTEKLKTHYTDMREHSDRIDKLEDEVITLKHNGTNDGVNNISPSSSSIFEGSVLQRRMEKLKGRVEDNNELLNKLIGWERSSMQLKGIVIFDHIEWQKEISNGDIISIADNKLHVRSGGTQFQYALMKDRGVYGKSPVARVKHTCIRLSNSFDFTLNLQKVVEVDLGETVSFYLNVSSNALSNEPSAHHVFGIIEV